MVAMFEEKASETSIESSKETLNRPKRRKGNLLAQRMAAFENSKEETGSMRPLDKADTFRSVQKGIIGQRKVESPDSLVEVVKKDQTKIAKKAKSKDGPAHLDSSTIRNKEELKLKGKDFTMEQKEGLENLKTSSSQKKSADISVGGKNPVVKISSEELMSREKSQKKVTSQEKLGSVRKSLETIYSQKKPLEKLPSQKKPLEVPNLPGEPESTRKVDQITAFETSTDLEHLALSRPRINASRRTRRIFDVKRVRANSSKPEYSSRSSERPLEYVEEKTQIPEWKQRLAARKRAATVAPKSVLQEEKISLVSDSKANQWALDYEKKLKEKYKKEFQEEEERIRRNHENVDELLSDDQRDFKIAQALKGVNLTQKLEYQFILGADRGFASSWIGQFMCESADNELEFSFVNKVLVFKAFGVGSPEKRSMMRQFASAICTYPEPPYLTSIDVSNSGLDDDFLKELCDGIEAGNLKHLRTLNLESNFFEEEGLLRVAQVVKDSKSLPELRELLLENQKDLLSSQVELAFDNALKNNESITRLGIRVRNMGLRVSIDSTVTRNSDVVRKERNSDLKRMGIVTEKPKNEVQLVMDRIKKNDPEITEFSITGDQLFLTLDKHEVEEFAGSLGKNTNLKLLKLNNVNLDKEFGFALAKSLEENTVLEEINLENNCIPSEAIEAICVALEFNTSVKYIYLRSQTGKLVSSTSESKIFEALKDTKTLLKLGLAFRTKHLQDRLDKTLFRNLDQVKRFSRVSQAPELTRRVSKFVQKNSVRDRIEKIIVGEDTGEIFEYTEDRLFISLKKELKEQLAISLARDSTVKVLRLIRLGITDDFAMLLAESLKSNTKIEEVNLESNKLTTKGLEAVCMALGENSSLKKLYLKHQMSSKSLTSAAEMRVADVVHKNETILKLGLSMRGTSAENMVSRALLRNAKVNK